MIFNSKNEILYTIKVHRYFLNNFIFHVLSGVLSSESPVLKPLLVPANIEVGDVTEIYCIIKKGSQPVTFKWLHNGKEIHSHPKYKISTTKTSSHFYIGEIEASDIGNFTCIANNPFGMDSMTETVSMEGKIVDNYSENP